MEWRSNLYKCNINNKLQQLYLNYSLSYLLVQKRTTKKYNEVRLMFNALMNSQNDAAFKPTAHHTHLGRAHIEMLAVAGQGDTAREKLRDTVWVHILTQGRKTQHGKHCVIECERTLSSSVL